MAAPYTNIRFSDAAMPRIAQAAGYNATPYNKEGFQQFLAQNPDAKAKYEQFQQQAVGTMMAARGGIVRFVDGGMVRNYALGGIKENNTESSNIVNRPNIDPATIDPNRISTTTEDDINKNSRNSTTLKDGLEGIRFYQQEQRNKKQLPQYTVNDTDRPLSMPSPTQMLFANAQAATEYTNKYNAWLRSSDPSTLNSHQRSDWEKLNNNTNTNNAPNRAPQDLTPEQAYNVRTASATPQVIETTAALTPEQQELQDLGAIRENERTQEETDRLNELRESVGFTYGDQELSAQEALDRYNVIKRKRADLVTSEDKDFAKQYRAMYGYVPLPEEGLDTSPDVVKRTTAMQEGLTPEGEPILTEAMTVDAFGVPLTQEQLIGADVGQAGAVAPTATTAMGQATQAQPITATQAATMEAATTQPQVQAELAGLQAAQGTVTNSIAAAEEYNTNVSNAVAAQGEGILLNNQVTRELQNGEIIDPVANAEKAAQFMESIQAATATPSEQATVRGQLESLYKDFDAANPPPWAAGAMRAANATMAARGLSASSMAGQAVIQAAMESAVPIAQADASVFAQFEVQNLSNRQQRAMLAAQQRAQFMGQEFDQAFQARVANAAKISDIANMNFNAEQQVQLENSRIANTVNLQNLSNRNAVVLAEASALANLEMASLNNRQQAAVQNAQNFLQMDMANLNNRQQTSIFSSQQAIQSMFTDAAARNAAAQFNAQSQNQTDQFFANLKATTDQFNVAQSNAMNQFNAGQLNANAQFNANIQAQRDQFNAQNALVVSQSNAAWRRQIATADTAALNRANELNARSTLELSTLAYNNMWQLYKDVFEFAFQAEEGRLDRENNLSVAEIQARAKSGSSSGSIFGQIAGTAVAAIARSFLPSDIRLKKNIQPIKDYGNGIKMYEWEWRDNAKKLGVNIRQTRGFIAQNVLKYFPDLVERNEDDGYLRVNYLGVVKKCMG